MNFRCLLDAFHYQIRHRGDQIALMAEDETGRVTSWSWDELSTIVESTAGWLRRQLVVSDGAQPVIGYASDNSPNDIFIALASMLLGAVEVPIDHRLRGDDIDFRWSRITDGKDEALWVDRESLPSPSLRVHNSTSRQPSPSVDSPQTTTAPSLILWTSGTTGTPQGVTLTSRSLCLNAGAKLRCVPQKPEDVRLCVLPVSHAYARTCDLGTWLLSGCTLAITLGFDGLTRLAAQARPTLMNVVPAMANRLLHEEVAGLERLRLLGCGGAPLAAADFEQWRRRGVTVIQGYGLTETSPVICSATPGNATPGLVGDFVDGWEWSIRDGQLFVRGGHLMRGYWNDRDATADRVDEEGWLRTGDLVEWDAERRQLRVLGRADDVIVLETAVKIHPASIERQIQQIRGVKQALLVDRNPLELWYEAEQGGFAGAIEPAIRAELNRHHALGQCVIQAFQQPLSEREGELTAKGTIRRKRVMENRFSD